MSPAFESNFVGYGFLLLAPSPDSMRLGVGIVGVLLALWWNVQYLRFMRFWIEPPYKPWTVLIFRVFFALCFGGALFSSVQDIMHTQRSQVRPFETLKFCLGWGLAMVALVYLAEAIKRKRTPESENTSGK